MAVATRKIEVEILGDSSQLERTFKRASNSATKFNQDLTRGQRAMSFAKQGAAVAGFSIGIETAGRAMIDAVQAASNMNEMLSKTDAVFEDSAGQVREWAKTTTDAFGISERQALATASSFGALFAPIGLVGTEAAKQSEMLTELGADLASFYDTDVQAALDAIRSGLVGESEPLRQYGVRLSETRVQAEALAQTHKRSAKQLTEQEKAFARISIIMRDTTKAQGDSARTSDSFANKMRKAQANIDNLKVAIGTGLLPMLTGLVEGFNDVVGVVGDVNRKFEEMHLGFLNQGLLESKKGVDDWLRDNHLGFLTRGLKDLGDQAEKTGEQMKKAVPKASKGFRDLGALAPPTTTERVDPKAAARATDLRNQWFDATIGRRLSRVDDRPLRDQIADLDRIAVLIQERIDATKDITRRLNLEDDLLDVRRRRKGVVEELRDQAEERRQAIAEAARQQFEESRGWLDIKARHAEMTTSIRDDLAVLREQESLIRQQIAVEGRTVENVSALLDIQDRRRQLIAEANRRAAEDRKRAAEEARARTTARQFQLLGLGPTGGEIIPTAKALGKRLGTITDAIEGTFLDTKANAAKLKQIGKALADGIKNGMDPEVRRAIKEMFDNWRRMLNEKVGTRRVGAGTSPTSGVWGTGIPFAGGASTATGVPDPVTGKFVFSTPTVPTVPTVPAAAGRPFGAFSGQTTIHNLNLYGVQNVPQLENELLERAEQRPQPRRGG